MTDKNKNLECKICGTPKSEGVEFHVHHIKRRADGGGNEKENLIEICSDCHHDIHYPGREDGELDSLEDDYRHAIESNIFSEGWGIIPRKVAHDPDITGFSKILYCEISSLCAERGYCWASNAYFAKVFNVSQRTITRAIGEIEKYIIIRNALGGRRTIWVHQLNSDAGKKGFRPVKKPVTHIVEKSEPKKSTPKFTDKDLFLAESLLSRIIYNFPDLNKQKVKMDAWANEIRLLREQIEEKDAGVDADAAAHKIHFMIYWIQGGTLEIPGKANGKRPPHDFWAKNILSAAKLRKQWFTLVPQLRDDYQKTVKKSAVVKIGR